MSDGFARELMRTCAAPEERMSSPELRVSSARMLKVTGGCWPRNVPIPRAASGDVFTSRMVRKWRVFPYGRNIAVVVSAVFLSPARLAGTFLHLAWFANGEFFLTGGILLLLCRQ